MGEGLMNVHSFSIYSTLEFCQEGKQFNAKTAQNRFSGDVQYQQNAPFRSSGRPLVDQWQRGILFGPDKRGRNPDSKISLTRTAGKNLQTQRLSYARVEPVGCVEFEHFLVPFLTFCSCVLP